MFKENLTLIIFPLVLDHWLVIAGKANHSIFKITKDQAKKIVVDTTKKQAAWTFKIEAKFEINE